MRGEQPGQRHREDDAGPVGQHAGDGQRAGLEQAGPHRLDAGPGPVVEEELGAEGRADRVGSQGHGGRHALDEDLGRRRLGLAGRHPRSPCIGKTAVLVSRPGTAQLNLRSRFRLR